MIRAHSELLFKLYFYHSGCWFLPLLAGWQLKHDTERGIENGELQLVYEPEMLH